MFVIILVIVVVIAVILVVIGIVFVTVVVVDIDSYRHTLSHDRHDHPPPHITAHTRCTRAHLREYAPHGSRGGRSLPPTAHELGARRAPAHGLRAPRASSRPARAARLVVVEPLAEREAVAPRR